MFGAEKQRHLQRAWVLACPSHSEVIGLVNLEAALNGVPSITTFETGLYDWEEGGGLLVHPRVEEVRCAIEVACSWNGTQRQQRANASRELVLSRYSWRTVLPKWQSLYESLVGQ